MISFLIVVTVMLFLIRRNYKYAHFKAKRAERMRNESEND